jgi:CheY-like chemotaxis protein
VSERPTSGAAAAAQAARVSGQKEGRTLPRASKTVLCIDDHQNAVAGWSLYLHGAGYRVLTSTEPTEGLELFATQPVDAVLLDYTMPGMDGAEVSRCMKRMKPGVPIILFSGHILPNAAVEAVDAVLFKGEPPQNVLGKLDELLGAA